ncbi:hypothetical protein OIE82_13055 [Streptomyces althioticus]|jgi:hypothetical protein|uniref:Uncharacterized protein n=1 Tax=Streptomyces althioticus TaxID=83380 RepID=A0ABZ1Y3G6_9ACTN|nr:hypothetical protein OHA53_22490 [Streptomyces althioticus]GGQ66403.1 hypothetical protein GCM10010267_32170 [Streptomyces griseorubens]
MSLEELIAQADERGLAVSGVACLDRCVPLLGGDDEALRPLWGTLAGGPSDGDWGEVLRQTREKLDAAADEAAGGGAGEAAELARGMLATAPLDRSGTALRQWADRCSADALRIHQLLDGAGDAGATDLTAARSEGRTDGLSPLLAAELRRQTAVLELVAAHGAAGLRSALEVSTEGRRVLRAAVSRRSRRDA